MLTREFIRLLDSRGAVGHGFSRFQFNTQLQVDVGLDKRDLEFSLEEFSIRFLQPMAGVMMGSVDGRKICEFGLKLPAGDDCALETFHGVTVRGAFGRLDPPEAELLLLRFDLLVEDGKTKV